MRGLRGFIWNFVGKRFSESDTSGEAADEAYDAAMGMCGNEGQVAIIDMTGYDAFVSAAQEAFDDGDAYGVLMAACPHPDAVGEILAEAAGIIEEYVEEARGAFGDRVRDEEEDEEDDENDDYYDEWGDEY